LDKGYRVIGAHRRGSSLALWRLGELGVDPSDIELAEFELLEQSNIQRVLERTQPDEVYNLAAQTFVGTSFEQPTYTGDVNGLGVARLLEAIRTVNPRIRFYQASTSEMFGNQPGPQHEKTPFAPRSPYGVAKLYAHWLTINYREAHGLFACAGILFNHESPLRGLEFVTRKITHGLARIHGGNAERLALGNLNASRDWGYAGDYVEGMWAMLQQEKPDDYVLATGTTATVRTFCNMAADALGMALDWNGDGIDERGIWADTGQTVVKVSRDLYRPTEVDCLVGDSRKASTILGWQPKTSLHSLASMMAEADVRRVRDAPELGATHPIA
jgi:GDPmannose 4,6-dehydratase